MADVDWVTGWKRLAPTLVHTKTGQRERATATLVVDGVNVFLEGNQVGDRPAWGHPARLGDGFSSTRIKAAAPGAGALELDIRRGRSSPFEPRFDFGRETTGDQAFDDWFVVKTRTRPLALPWLVPEVRSAMLLAREYVYEVHACEATAWVPAIETDGVKLSAALRALARLAGRLPKTILHWRDLAAQIGARYIGLVPAPEDGSEPPWWKASLDPKRPPFDGLEIEADHEGVRVGIDACLGKWSKKKRAPAALYTRARCRRSEGQAAELSWTLAGGPKGPFDGALLTLFWRAGVVAAFTDGDHVTLMREGLVNDPESLRSMVAAAVRLADGEAHPTSRGPYR